MKRPRSEKGAALIELAIVMPALMIIFGGIAESGLLFRAFEVTTNAAREGARLAALPGNELDNYAIPKARVSAYLLDAGLTGPSTVVVTPETVPLGTLTANGARVTVTYTYNCLFLGPVLGLINGTFASTITLESSTLMRIQVAGVSPS
jgi:Flp pilus assembly protein TadG